MYANILAISNFPYDFSLFLYDFLNIFYIFPNVKALQWDLQSPVLNSLKYTCVYMSIRVHTLFGLMFV